MQQPFPLDVSCPWPSQQIGPSPSIDEAKKVLKEAGYEIHPPKRTPTLQEELREGTFW